MVVTSEDYFRFINGNSYFSNKLSTVLHEKHYCYSWLFSK
ncbi:hypothetical protein ACP0HM_30185 [Escherichia coli]